MAGNNLGRIMTELANPPQLRTNPPPRRAVPGAEPSVDFGQLEGRLLARLNKRVHFVDFAFATVTDGTQLRPQENRYYLFIMNTGAAGNLIVSFTGTPDATGTSGMVMGPGGFYEPDWTPDNSIFVIGSAVGVTGYCIIATQLADE